MSNTYLEKFRSALPTAQGKQILKLLIGKRDRGEITTIDEFKARLTSLTSKLLAERITPTLELYTAIPGEDISSDQFNEMIERIEDDLNAAFAEADNLDKIIAAHHNIINRIALKALRFAINELESKVRLYEFINRSGKGFDSALFNTFRESQSLSTARSDHAASLVYTDPRKSVLIGQSQDAHIDVVGERLTLGAETSQFLNIKEASWLSNANSIRSELNVEFPNSRISNIIDQTNDTYWVTPVLLSEVRQAGVPMEVCLGLSATQDVNFIEIEPAVDFPLVLTGIDYFDANNIRRSIGSVNQKLTGPTRINFGRATATCLILQFRQDNYKEVQFRRKPGESNFHKAVLGESNLPVDIDSISDDLKEMLSSQFILSDIMGITEQNNISQKYFQYILGFDNIRIGFNTFNERSVFVSQKKNLDHPGQVGLRTIETRPTEVGGTVTLQPYNYPIQTAGEDAKFYHGSIEYWLVTQLFSEDDFLISTDTVPLLPIGARRIYHEQLIFTKKSSTVLTNPDMGSLIFYANHDEVDIKVYKNGTLMSYSTIADDNSWEFVGDGQQVPADNVIDAELTQTIPGQAIRMKRGIHIHEGVQSLDIFTVSYTPVVSNTQTISKSTDLLKIVDMIGDKTIRVVSENILVFDSLRNSHTIARAEMYLTVIMRRNSADINFSPAVEEYMLVTGSRDQNKFVGD